ncbi:sigma-70 domain-containing protein [Lacrimispora algidixylanolytica]|uniref:RNA polymerase subunit sigma-70 n=1 Tax=Lacrimispora algidixylanolytica TaxID=94868 RepID=A0A419T079_9FIRM|nr:sigma-70 domain-containing protein [Lacrimispora algidixylanolytica]RKD30954.1 RNA polymerase subunit sigma-70 [Lacrimispora algidixylanolytica]
MNDDFYQMYLEEMEDISPCTKEETEMLLKNIKEGNKEAKKRLVEGNLKTALSYAKEFDGKGVLLTDLVQEANMALMMAVERYDGSPTKEEFDRFAGDLMNEFLLEAVQEEVSAEQTAEELAARVNVLQTVSSVLAKELGREATIDELADKMKMTVEEIHGIMKIALDAMSINTEDMDMEALEGADGFDLIEQEDEDYKG